MLWAGNLNFLLRVVIWNNLLSLIKLSDKKLLLAKAKFGALSDLNGSMCKS